MQSKRKSNSVVTHALSGNFGPDGHYSGAITFAVPEVGEFAVEMNRLPVETKERAAIHGIIQKVSDRAAIGRDPETGAPATPEEKFAAMKETAERLMSGGPWNAVQTRGAGASGGLLYRAMRGLYPNTWDTKAAFAEFIRGKAAKLGRTESDVRDGYAELKNVAKEMKRLRDAETKPSGIDPKELLAGLPQ